MKWKHLPLLLLALLATGACVASPFVISELQNRRILQSAMADSAVPLRSTLDIESRNLSHIEKMQLYSKFGTANTSITCTRQTNNHGTRLTRATFLDTALDEMEALFRGIYQDPSFTLEEEQRASFILEECTPLTFIDRDDLPCHAILWIASMQSDNYHILLLLDDETHKIYSLSLTRIYSSVDRDSESAASVEAEMLNSISAFNEYLGLPQMETEKIWTEIDAYSDDPNSIVWNYRDENGSEIPIQFGIYDLESFSIEILSARGLDALLYY